MASNFVSRAENKLKDAAEAFGFDFRGKVVLDIGSSTGGFTEYALSRGAKKVIAIEKGTNQMKSPLRLDKRIELHEKTDIFEITTHDVIVQAPDVILADVSFVSLRKVLRHAKNHLANSQTDFLVMLKPQFEANDSQLNRGVVKNEKIRRAIIHDFETWLKNNNFLIFNKRDNDFFGKNGNQERFYWLRLASSVK
ncbi:hypothetical protein J6Z37_00025 [Candidatus Saccharibacteria bacterium]|nr:hypothetical protein [Candidatus Saccharibacteria bacterium]